MKPNPRFGESEPAPRHRRQEKPRAQYVASRAEEERILQQIRAYLGVPYRWGGTTVAGMDCSGFVSTVYKKAVGLKLPHSAKMMYRLGER
ncbi:MAG: cell wall lytic activity, partial [Calditrichaeota bacterium]